MLLDNSDIRSQLDILDPYRTFGLSVPRLATTSSSVLSKLLNLSAATCGIDGEKDHLILEGLATFQAISLEPSTLSSSDALQGMVVYVLQQALVSVETDVYSWESVFVGSGGSISFTGFKQVNETDERIWHSCVTLMFRLGEYYFPRIAIVCEADHLEIAYCLVNESAPAVTSDMLTELHSQLKGKEHDSLLSETRDVALNSLILLADTMQCFSTPTKEQVRDNAIDKDSDRDDNWAQLFLRLRTWHSARPLDLLPLVGDGNNDSPTYVPIFTNSIGFATHIFYHTSLIFLLRSECKPVDHMNLLPRAQRIPSWHARRVYQTALGGIASPGYWDPCVIGCITLAARYLGNGETSGLSSCLRSIQKAGWRVDSLHQSPVTQRPVSLPEVGSYDRD